MPIVDPKVNDYMLTLAPSEHPVLREMEAIAKANDFPIIGSLCGRILYQYALLIGAKSVFEMGSGYGYSAFYFCNAVGPQGKVVLTDGDPENSKKSRELLGTAGFDDRTHYEVGNAMDIIRRYDGPYDIIYIDVDKDGYPEALELAIPRVRTGGLIITDNVLWSGKVADANPDETTRAIQRYTQMAYGDPSLLTTILSVRDGLAVSLKLRDGQKPRL